MSRNMCAHWTPFAVLLAFMITRIRGKDRKPVCECACIHAYVCMFVFGFRYPYGCAWVYGCMCVCMSVWICVSQGGLPALERWGLVTMWVTALSYHWGMLPHILWGDWFKGNGNLYSINLLWMSNSTESTPEWVRHDSINSDWGIMIVTQSINIGEFECFWQCSKNWQNSLLKVIWIYYSVSQYSYNMLIKIHDCVPVETLTILLPISMLRCKVA